MVGNAARARGRHARRSQSKAAWQQQQVGVQPPAAAAAAGAQQQHAPRCLPARVCRRRCCIAQQQQHTARKGAAASGPASMEEAGGAASQGMEVRWLAAAVCAWMVLCTLGMHAAQPGGPVAPPRTRSFLRGGGTRHAACVLTRALPSVPLHADVPARAGHRRHGGSSGGACVAACAHARACERASMRQRSAAHAAERAAPLPPHHAPPPVCVQGGAQEGPEHDDEEEEVGRGMPRGVCAPGPACSCCRAVHGGAVARKACWGLIRSRMSHNGHACAHGHRHARATRAPAVC